MSDSVTLPHLQSTYRRVSTRIYRLLEDGYDFDVAERIIETLNLDARIVDAAFFVLIFGQIENRLNELAVRRVKDKKGQAALRETKFGRRLKLALPGPENAAIRSEIAGWYGLRSDAAHGERLTHTYNVPNVFGRAFVLDALVSEQLDHAGEEGKAEP
jgi:hypothetical protein